MKKRISFILLFIICISFFVGCGQDFISKFSKNIDCYEINIELDDKNHTAKCTQQVEYVNNTNQDLNEIYFHLYANAFKQTAINKPVSSLYETKAYYNGFSEGCIDLQKVSVNGEDVEILYEDQDSTLLKVLLINSLNNKQKIKINFEYVLTIPNINHRFGYGENTINLGNFYPIACVFEENGFDKNGYHYNGDPFYSNLANYNVKVTYDSNLKLTSTGLEQSVIEKDNKKTTCLKANAVRDFALIFSNKFETLSMVENGTQVNYLYYSDKTPDKSLETAVLSLKTFNKLFGEYPYKILNVVESNFVHGGMEFPCLVLISDALDNYEDYTETIVHEIAHQWWYGVVGNNEFEYGWLDEGLAEYSTALFFEKNVNYNINYKDLIKNAQSSYCLFVDVYKDVFGKVDTSMNRKLNEFNTEPEYVYISYVKGMLMFDDLRNMIGQNKFIKGLQKYYATFKGKNAIPENMINTFEKVCGYSLHDFFYGYIDGKVVIMNN